MKQFFSRINNKIYFTLFIIGGGLLYLKVISPMFGIHIPCLFRQVTGYYCPGCGMTRASLALLDGQLYQSFRYNMLIFIVLPLLVVFYSLEHKGKIKQSKFLMGAMVVLTVLFGVLRNVEWFNWLAPVLI